MIIHNELKEDTNLEIRVEQSERPDRVQLLDRVDKPEPPEGLRGAVRRLESNSGPGIIRLNNHDARRVGLLVSESNGLEKTKRLNK